MITFEDFQKLEIKIGAVLSAEKVEGADKLITLRVDLGNEERQVVVGMAEFIKPEHFIGKQLPLVTNLEPRKLRGIESHGMVLAIDVNNEPILLLPEKEVPAGSIVR